MDFKLKIFHIFYWKFTIFLMGLAMLITLKSWKEYGKGMKKFDKENGSSGRDKKKTMKFSIADQPECSSENTENLK